MQLNYLLIEESIRLLINSSGITIKQVYCIAVACPGVFNGNGGFISRNPHFTGIDWSKFDFINHFKSVFGIKTIVMNDINAATLGQWSMDDDEQINNFLFLSCGEGLGAGLILNGSLYEGSTYSVGEIFNYIDFARINKGVTIEEEICLKALVNRCTIAN